MLKALLSSLCFVLFLQAAWAQTPPAGAVDDAGLEGVRRQAYRKDYDDKLKLALEAEKKGDLNEAARLYTACLDLVRRMGPGNTELQAAAMRGFAATRVQLADQFMRAGEYGEAELQVNRVLKEDPKNELALKFKATLEATQQRQAGRLPSPGIVAETGVIQSNNLRAASLAVDAKILYEAGRLDEAAKYAEQALKLDPGNRAAIYYQELIMDQTKRRENLNRERFSKERILEVDKAWNVPPNRGGLPVPNPYARTNMVFTGKGRQRIYQKLETIRLAEVTYDALPLGQVIDALGRDVRNSDTDKKGINFIVSGNIDPPAAPPPAVDPQTGLPIAQEPTEAGTDLGTVTIKISPPLRDVTLGQVLDAIVKVADRPIKYSVEEYAVVFTFRAAESPPLFTRWYKVDPNTFMQGLQGVTSYTFGETSAGGGGGYGGGGFGGGGGRGGGGYGGGGYGGGGYGGGGYGGGGQGGGYGSSGSSEYVGVSLAGGGFGGGRGGGRGGFGGGFGGGGGSGTGGIPLTGVTGGGGAAGRPGGGGAGGGAAQAGGGGVAYLTQLTPVSQIIQLVREFFFSAGITLDPPKNVYFNERLGMLMVHATLQELDIIEEAIQVLNMSPPQVTIEAKFAEIGQNDAKALGFDWWWGNTLMKSGAIGAQGGTAPSFGSPDTSGSPANPTGIFPTPPISPTTTDGRVTQGLRFGTTDGSVTAPAVATITGILTDPQFRVVIRAMEQREGVDVLAAPKVTTLSARQAQIKLVEVRYIVTALDTSQTSSGGGVTTGGITTGGGGVGSIIQPIAEPQELGPILDVVPYVSADGYTVQMTIIPTVKTFVGYDLQSAQIFSTQVQSVGGVGAAQPLVQPTPLPIFRLRQVVTSAIVWDGQTVVLGGLIAEEIQKLKDKVPVIGDLPLVGRFFTSEAFATKKKNLVIFVTPTIIDPAGNRMHSEEEMPFAQNAIPPQTPIVPQPGARN